MKLFAIRSVVVFAIMIAGCQSGPRWAWWKHDKASEDSSLLARSAAPPATAIAATTGPKTAPALPSSQSTPQAVAASGMGAPSPSSMNLANAAKPAGTPTTTAGTVPTAAAAVPAVTPIAAATKAATPLTGPAAGAAPTGPYNPSAYQSSAALASVAPVTNAAGGNPNLERVASATPNRYGMPPATTPAIQPSGDPMANRYGIPTDNYSANQSTASTSGPSASVPVSPPGVNPASTAAVAPPASVSTNVSGSPVASGAPIAQAIAPVSGDRYGLRDYNAVAPSGADATGSAAATTPAAAPTSLAGTQSAPASAVYPAAAAVPTSVQLTAAPGQYRPGGTSTYVASPAVTPIEVASRPAPPVATPPSGPATIPSTSTVPTTGSRDAVPMVPAVPTGVGSRY